MTKEEAIKVAYGIPVTKAQHEALQFLIPELTESEDERIRKDLIHDIQMLPNLGVLTHRPVSEYIAYLEKQKESKKEFHIPSYIGMAHYNPVPIEQKEDKDELVYRLNGLMQDYIKEGKDDEEKEHRLKCYQLFWDALEDTNFFEQKEQKPAWSEDIIRKAIKEVGLTQHQIDWFKTNVFPPKQEWSEEDEKMLTGIIERGSVQVPPYTTALREEQIEWLMNRLKSLRTDTFQNGNSRPKTSDNWKPAQEQEEPEYYQHFDPDC